MSSISITACSFYLRRKNTKTIKGIYNLNDPISLPNSSGLETTYPNIFIIFKNFFERYKLMEIDDEKQQSYKCEFNEKDRIETNDYIVYCARVYSGDYGSTSDIINLQTKKIKYQKKIDDIDVKPFYIFIVIPKDSQEKKVQKGMLIFQNIGPYGIKTITTEQMQDFFSQQYNISIQCNCIASKLFIERILRKDKVKKLYLIKNYKSKDIADNISKGYGTEIRVLANLELNENQWQNIINSVKYASQGKYNLFEFEHKKYDNAKINVKVGEHERTINVHNIDKLSIIEDVPDEIKNKDGHPDKSKLIDYIKTVVEDYLSEMILKIEERDFFDE